MRLGNSPARYGFVSKLFHWLTALLIVTIIPLGITANGMAEAFRQATPDSAADLTRAALLFSMHKTLGLTIFLTALARIAWTMSQTKPRPLHPERRIELLAAETVHWLLYGSLLLVPLTGWFSHAATTGFAPIWWPFGQNLPFIPVDPVLASILSGLHKVLEWVLVVALALHIAGALKHHLIDRDQTLLRMWFGRRDLPHPQAHPRSALPIVLAVTVWAMALGAGLLSGAISAHRGSVATPEPLAQPRSDWQVEQGSLTLTITQLGTPVTGAFADWTAAIAYADPSAPGVAGQVRVEVSIASLTLGSVTDQALRPDFLDHAAHPTATYSAEIQRTDTGHVANGILTLRGISMPVLLPFSLQIHDDVATMSGQVDLNRLDYGIGAALADQKTLGQTVTIAVELVARRTIP
ncbi:cytochrome b/b6 domain-containing protein [Sedimentitalea sp. HM32M-2]|uniref:cytochrome b/b6 domain-containing protein n=1 Tax=Sedimentitalea sp. HM32M-2 TaxID=3351566 RepID=UPI00362E3965